MLIPCSQWYCDHCGEIIFSPKDANLVCRKEESPWCGNYLIVHKICSPKYSLDDYLWESLEKILNARIGVMVKLLDYLDVWPFFSAHIKPLTPIKVREWTELVRRLTRPYYEEARRYLDIQKLSPLTSDTVAFYKPESLQKFISENTEKMAQE